MTREALIEQINDASLRGRGGAGFPMGRKLSLVPGPDKRPGPAYVVANADESEPGASRTARSCAASRTASSRAA